MEMRKIIIGLLLIAMLVGGFVAGYQYKCMEEEQLFGELFIEVNEEWDCSCYYTGDMRRGFECFGSCAETRMEEYGSLIEEKYRGVIYCKEDNQDWTCEKIQKECMVDCDWKGVAIEWAWDINERTFYRAGYLDAQRGYERDIDLKCDEIWSEWRNLKVVAENEGMQGVSEKEWNCLWCDLVWTGSCYGACPVPGDIKEFCNDWGEGMCYVCEDSVEIGV